jgi:hypothetical protein
MQTDADREPQYNCYNSSNVYEEGERKMKVGRFKDRKVMGRGQTRGGSKEKATGLERE